MARATRSSSRQAAAGAAPEKTPEKLKAKAPATKKKTATKKATSSVKKQIKSVKKKIVEALTPTKNKKPRVSFEEAETEIPTSPAPPGLSVAETIETQKAAITSSVQKTLTDMFKQAFSTEKQSLADEAEAKSKEVLSKQAAQHESALAAILKDHEA